MSPTKILIVEDESIVALDLRRILTRAGYAVTQIAVSGSEAIDSVKTQSPDAVLMDIGLSGDMNGITAAQRILEFLEIPIIYVTANSDLATVQQAQTTNPFGYVLKPFDEREIRIVVEMALYKHRIDQEVKESRAWLGATLHSIGDAVIATDAKAFVKFMNPVAESLTGWKEDEAIGKSLTDVFRILNEHTRQPVDNPAQKALQVGRIVGLANHTLLIARDGREIHIDDSAAPILEENGRVNGVVLTFRDITEKRRAEEAVRQSERKYHTLIDTMSEGILQVGNDDVIQFANKRFCEMFGYNDDELIGQIASEILVAAPQDKDLILKKNESRKEGVSDLYHIRLKKKSGEVRWIQIGGAPVVDAQGKVIGSIGVHTDITEHKQAESQLRQLSSAIEQTADCVVITNRNGIIEYVNHAFETTTGYSKEETLGKSPRISKSGKHGDDFYDALWKTILSGEVFRGVVINRKKNGELYYEEKTITPLRDADGNTTHFVSTGKDITERMRTEEELRKLSRAVEQSPVSIIITDTQGQIEYVNPRFCEVTSYTAEESLGQNPRFLQSGEMPKEGYAELWQTITGGKEWRGELHNKKRNGDLFWEFASISPITNTQGEITHYLAVKEEITERKKLEERLHKQNTYLKTLNEITLGLINRLDTKDLLQAVITQAGALIGSPNGFIDFFMPEEGVIEQRFSSGRYEELNGFRHSIEEGVSGKIWKTGNPCVVNDYDSWSERASNLPKGMLHAVIGVPLKSGTQLIGVLGFEGETTFNDEQVELLKGFAELASITLDNARLYTASQQELLERKKTEAILRDSEERYRALVENLPVGVYVSQNNKFVYANAVFTQMLGASTPEHLIGQIVSERIYAGDLPQAEERFKSLMTTDVIVPLVEERYIRLDGSTLVSEATGTRITLGGSTALQTVVIDVGERKRTEEALRHSEAQLRLITNNMLDMIAQTDMKGNFIYASPSHRNVLGYDPEWLSEHTLFEFIHPDDLTRVMTAIQIGKETSGAGRMEVQYRHAKGHYIWLETVGNVLLDDHNEMVGGVFSSREITKRKNAELQLERNAAQIAGLNLMSQTITATLDLEVIFRKIVDELMLLLEAEELYILLLEGNELVIAVTGGSGLERFQGWRMPATEGVVGKVAQSGQSLRITEPEIRSFVSHRTEEVVGHQVHSILAMPLRIGEKIIGVIEAAHSEVDFFDENDLRLLQSATLWASIAINNARQHAQTGRSLQESETLASISSALNEILDLDLILQMIVDAARNIVPKAERSVIHLIDEENVALRPVAISGIEHRNQPKITMRPGEGVAGQVLATGQTINVGNIQKDSRYVPLRSDTALRSILAAPIQSGPVTIGTVSIMSDTINAFTVDDERVLTRLGVQAALAIDKARAYETERRRAEQAEALQQVMQRLIGHIDLTQAFQSVVNTIALVARYKYVRIFLLKDNALVLQAQNEKSRVTIHTRHLNEGIVGRVARSGVATLVPNVALDPDYVEGMPGTRSSIGIPLKRAQTVAGVLLVESDAERTLNANDMHWLVNIGQEISIAIENAELYNDLQEALLQEKTARTQLVRTEKLAGMGRLIASVAHELNNPLQAIQNALFLVKQEANLGGQAQDDLLVALSEADRMAELIGRLRETYRPTVAEKFQDGSLNALVVETQRLIATHIRHRNITFDFVPDPQLPLFPCVHDEVKQVLLNLSLNAVEAMDDGGQLRVRTGHDADKNEVWVSVSDTGVGIDPTTIANIFDPFFTTKEGGTGLGLFITHEIVQKHGGSVAVQSERGTGTTFKVTFPINSNRIA